MILSLSVAFCASFKWISLKTKKCLFLTLLVKRAFFHISEIYSHFFILQSGDHTPSITLGQKNIFWKIADFFLKIVFSLNLDLRLFGGFGLRTLNFCFKYDLFDVRKLLSLDGVCGLKLKPPKSTQIGFSGKTAFWYLQFNMHSLIQRNWQYFAF